MAGMCYICNKSVLEPIVMLWQPLPIPVLILAVISFLLFLRRGKNGHAETAVTRHEADNVSEEQRNMDAVSALVKKYEGYTAEVIPFNVFGKRKVETSRLKQPGSEIELRRYPDGCRVYAYGEYIADIFPDSNSNLDKLFDEKLNFYVYLGGRDRNFLYNDEYDSCSALIFYKIEGVAPTKVEIK